MPRLTKRRTARQPRWTRWHLLQLATKYFDFGAGWGHFWELPDDELRAAIRDMWECWHAHADDVREVIAENRWRDEPWFEQYADEAGPQRLFDECLAYPCRPIYLAARKHKAEITGQPGMTPDANP